VVINTIAGLINGDRHKVNLGAPDKVILVDIHQVSSSVERNAEISSTARPAS
jgi:hypothetical protein